MSYTFKASFWDEDGIPVYKTVSEKTLNADVNGALNIMRKSNVVDLSILYARGEVDTPHLNSILNLWHTFVILIFFIIISLRKRALLGIF